MDLFFITFDLVMAEEADYERVYEWAHRNGGYRYFEFPEGGWGRLPTTSICVRLPVASAPAARDLFIQRAEEAGLKVRHVGAVAGRPVCTSTPIPERLVPEYARRTVTSQ